MSATPTEALARLRTDLRELARAIQPSESLKFRITRAFAAVDALEAALAQREAEVAAGLAREAAQLQQSRRNEHELILRASRAEAALVEERKRALEEAAEVAEREPELPGDPSPPMLAALSERPEAVARACVSVTKRNIAVAIRALASSTTKGGGE